MPEIKAAAAIHSQRHAAGGPDQITPDDIGAPDVEQVSGTVDTGGASIHFGPGQALSNGAAIGAAFTTAEVAYNTAMAAAPKQHAANHATGGSDPIAPASIGAAPLYSGSTGPAMPVESGSYTGHVDEQTVPGVYRVSSSSMNEANGYPPTPNTTGTLVVQTSFSKAYLVQTVYSNRNEVIWTRARAAGTWHPWVQYQTVQDTGWREMPVDEWISTAAFPNITQQRLRRIGNTVWVGLRFEYEADKFSYRTTATPVGFRPSISAFSASVSGYTGDPIQIGVFGVNSSGTTFLRTRPGIDSSSTGFFTTSWLTDDSWPTTLPGTPA